MKDSEINSELKSLRVPERDPEYWDTFPERVTAELRSAPSMPPARPPVWPRLAWSSGWALSCLAAVFLLGHSRAPKSLCYALLKDERDLRRSIQHFPDHVRTFMQDEHGLHRLIEDQP
jgi:hypothetical protein